MCGFNAHRQILPQSSNDVLQLERTHRSPDLTVRCALWSAIVIEDDGELNHRGFLSSNMDPTIIEGPPPRNIKCVFGNTSGILGALSTDGSLYVLQHDTAKGKRPEFRKHHFHEESFFRTQNQAIDHIAIADNGEVCIITSKSSVMKDQDVAEPSRQWRARCSVQ